MCCFTCAVLCVRVFVVVLPVSVRVHVHVCVCQFACVVCGGVVYKPSRTHTRSRLAILVPEEFPVENACDVYDSVLV